jgi:hypothetical protein
MAKLHPHDRQKKDDAKVLRRILMATAKIEKISDEPGLDIGDKQTVRRILIMLAELRTRYA